MKEKSIESLYRVKKRDVGLERHLTLSGKSLEFFKAPGVVTVKFEFLEFTCRCPRTGQPDFAKLVIDYIPTKLCVEMKALKYYLNSFRDEGHFHEEVIYLIEKDLRGTLEPEELTVTGIFNVRGGIYPTIVVGDGELRHGLNGIKDWI